ncbi:MAG: hypothetical protein A2430_00210 [Candidatus Liptonbacteria bacterium RIFOXYC1_FULL_36_8]|uniref:DNA ligase n=1 Tax=Candidatus Liptonbacteria bacterium RIFOXYC1_FULL_36_8 TaxID=1798655 RepID=A0A1G2CRK0_9BACT|nr:MAG: hypothetical protein A2430_00210 [Candidatus Liptonbacteria bacterium RIFOXYC1_FULL_36_8]
MDKQEAEKRAKKLRKLIDYYRNLYHTYDKPEISDAAFDTLKNELEELELKWPELVIVDSPTQKVGGKPRREFKKVRHEAPMISLSDAFSERELLDWQKRLENYLGKKADSDFYCELKIDGLAIELVYEDGKFKLGATRGNGITGEEVTENLIMIEGIPKKLKVKSYKLKVREREIVIPKKLVVRGEVFIAKKEFERINKEQKKKEEKLYANPRNVAAGSIRQLDPEVVASRKMYFFAYDIVTDLGLEKHEEKHKLLKELGFPVNLNNKLAKNLKEAEEFRNYWEKYREKLDYEVDGVVIIVNRNKVFEAGGVAGKAPRAAVAYKFSPREATTIIRNVLVQVGRTGTLTPVAELEPVEVGGGTISHATLHNYDEIKRLGLKIGDTVIVSRAGDVIPKITRVLPELRTGKEKEFKMPMKCPVDGASVKVEGVLYRCTNKNCGARHREQLQHFVSRTAFDIRGLGQKVLDRFLDEGLIRDAADIFTLKAGNIAVLERFGERSAENIIKEIEEKKRVSLSKFLYALGILHVGEETAQLLAKRVIEQISNSKKQILNKFQISIKKVLDFFKDFSLEKLQEISDVGPKVAESIFEWWHDKKNADFLERLERNGVEVEVERELAEKGKFGGKTFVLTGTLQKMAREEAKEKIRSLGGEMSESISKKTDFVVAGEKPGSKYKKAKELGVKIVEEKEFLEMVG